MIVILKKKERKLIVERKEEVKQKVLMFYISLKKGVLRVFNLRLLLHRSATALYQEYPYLKSISINQK